MDNWYTQQVHIHLGNEKALYDQAQSIVSDIADNERSFPFDVLAERLEDMVTPDGDWFDRSPPLIQSLLAGALEDVYWRDLAETFEDDFIALGGTKGDDGIWSWE